jgi:hypothetical protein
LLRGGGSALEDSPDPPYNDAMTTDEKLAAILAAVQTDPGNRGLARDPHDNLFTACPGDFTAACRSIADHQTPMVCLTTGFLIPTADPPAYETDGPLGAVFLARSLGLLGVRTHVLAEMTTRMAFDRGFAAAEIKLGIAQQPPTPSQRYHIFSLNWPSPKPTGLILVSIERVGPAANTRCYTMRGVDVTDLMPPTHSTFLLSAGERRSTTIGIGDGGNEIGMGKIPHETIVKNIPNGDLIHCRVPTDHLIVAGVSNWGAYALAAGVYVLRGVRPPADLFDPDREREILEVMVREGPLVDGVTGKQTATVDGLTWEEYAKPLLRIREILES